MDDLRTILGRTELLHGLLPQHLEALSECAAQVHYEANAYVSRSGATADAFWLIRQGLLAVSIQVPGRGEVTIDVMRAGDFVGFSWLCPPHLLHFDIHALTAVHAVRFDGHAVRERFLADASLGYEVTTRFARLTVSRIEAMSMQLLDLYGEHPNEPA